MTSTDLNAMTPEDHQNQVVVVFQLERKKRQLERESYSLLPLNSPQLNEVEYSSKMFGSSFRQYASAGASTFCVAMTAICFVWLEPLMQTLIGPDSEIPMTTSDTSWLVSSIEFGGLVATVPCGILADKYGRKPILLITGPMVLIGWTLVLTTRSLPILYFVRLIHGMSLAIPFTVAPMYIAEISEARIRGELSGYFQTMWYIGILFVYIIGPLFEYQNYTYICAVMPVIFIGMFSFVPESPYYYLMVGKNDKALKSLKWLRASEDVNEEFNAIQETVAEEMKGKGSWKDLFATKKDRKTFLVVQLVCIIKYFSGMSAITNYATENFRKGSDIDPHLLTIALGVLLCLTTICSAFVSDRIGRRPLILWSTFGSFVFNIIIGTYFYLVESTSIDMTPYSWIMMVSLAGFCIAANIGVSPLLQTIQAEYFPSNTRGIGSGITELTASLATFVNLKQFQVLADAFGIYANYWVFAVSCFFGFVLVYFVLPETAGKTLGQIQKIHDAPVKENKNHNP